MNRIYHFFNSFFNSFIEGVLRNHQGTENDVANVVSRILKYAPDRKGGSGRKGQ